MTNMQSAILSLYIGKIVFDDGPPSTTQLRVVVETAAGQRAATSRFYSSQSEQPGVFHLRENKDTCRAALSCTPA